MNPDVLIIGAGPAGSVVASLLHQDGFKPLIVEKTKFPRFMIGESLLPHCMDFLDQAGLLQSVHNKQYQIKKGAYFVKGPQREMFDFSEQFTPGWSYTYQVPRADFDHTLALGTENFGVPVLYEHEVISADFSEKTPLVKIRNAQEAFEIRPRFVLDASGFGRVLPRLLKLESPSGFPSRTAFFTHLVEPTKANEIHSDYIWIVVHPEHHYIWYWVIPFSHGRTSVGVVGPAEVLDKIPGDTEEKFRTLLRQEPELKIRLSELPCAQPVGTLTGYSANVSSLYGNGYALLGNAGEFLDPIFSSGVTIALKSASLAAQALSRHLRGEPYDWENLYARELKSGVDTFRTYVSAWYDGSFQDILFWQHKNAEIKNMICSILAGYVWDKSNPFVRQHERRIKFMKELCTSDTIAGS